MPGADNLKGKRGPLFPKGASGNPGGRPSVAKALEENGTTSAELLAKLIKIAVAGLDSKSERTREYSHLWLTERVLRIAKPKETLDLNIGGASPEQQIYEALRLTPQQRRDALAQDTTEPPDAEPGGD